MGNNGFVGFVVAKTFCFTKQHIFSIQQCHQIVTILQVTLPKLNTYCTEQTFST